MSCCFVSHGRRGNSWYSDVFCNVSTVESHFLAGAILLRLFQQMRCSFPSRRSTLDVSIVILRGRRSTLDVSCCVFFANRIVGVKWWQGANSRAGVAFCEMWWKLTEASHSEVHKKTRRKTSILKLQSVKIAVARYARFDAPTHLVSSLWFSCGLAVSMGKSLFFEGFQAGCHVFFLCRHGTWWHSNLFHSVLKVVLCGRRQIFASFSQDELQ